MRLLLAVAYLAFAGAASALETARGLATAGAPHLALARVEQSQPRDPGAPRWAEWEALRFDLLVALKRNDEILKRAAALPAALPQPLLRQCLLAAARAAVDAGLGAAARAHAARLLWQLEATPEEARAARLLVIDSHLAERQGEAAFRAMLRFEQDYRPLERAIAERFVEQLLDLGLEKEAVNWLANLDDAGALKLRLRLRAGLTNPDAAVAQARAQLARGGGAGYWQVLADAAEKQGNGALRLEALERLLHHSEKESPQRQRAVAAAVTQAYASQAQHAANQHRLLAGDDVAWQDLAARRLGADPSESRALFAHLARTGAARETRLTAQLQLVFSLYQSGLDHAALQLFSEQQAAPEALDSQARYLLGVIAESRNAPAVAVRFWRGLAAPPGIGAEEWQVRLATAQWRSGEADAALVTMRGLLKTAQPLPDAAALHAIALGREIRGAGRLDAADEVFAALLARAGGGHAREILQALGEIAEAAARFARAADYFLRAALVNGPEAADAFALRAREAAALNLARAGYREDARAQLQWLLRHSKDPAQLETARRELSRL